MDVVDDPARFHAHARPRTSRRTVITVNAPSVYEHAHTNTCTRDDVVKYVRLEKGFSWIRLRMSSPVTAKVKRQMSRVGTRQTSLLKRRGYFSAICGHMSKVKQSRDRGWTSRAKFKSIRHVRVKIIYINKYINVKIIL